MVTYEDTLIWDVTPCSLVANYQRFGGTYCLQLQYKRPEAVGSSETLLTICWPTWCQIPEQVNLQIKCRQGSIDCLVSTLTEHVNMDSFL